MIPNNQDKSFLQRRDELLKSKLIVNACPNCNFTDNTADAIFCTKCGAQLKKLNTIQGNLEFKEILKKRTATKHIIIYHSVSTAPHTIKDVHKWHKNKGMAGFAYHYFVNKKGDVFLGRPYDAYGAFLPAYNGNSIAICFEGDFSKQPLTDNQLSEKAIDLLLILSRIFKDADIVFCDDLKDYKHASLMRFDKEGLHTKLGDRQRWLETQLKKKNTTEKESLYKQLDSQCEMFGLPFRIR